MVYPETSNYSGVYCAGLDDEMKHSKARRHQCDHPESQSKEAWRYDVPTNWFRGDDVVLNVCKEHRKKEHHTALLLTPKAQKQL